MGNLNTKQMKNISYILCLSMIIVTNFLMLSCSSDSNDIPPISKSSESEITQFFFRANTNGIPQDISGTIDSDTKTIEVIMPFIVDVTTLIPEILISEKATLTGPLELEGVDVSKPIEYTVTAENGSTEIYTVSIIITKSTTSITTFAINAVDNEIFQTDVIGVINEANKEIEIVLPDVDISALKVSVQLSEGATINLDENAILDFTKSPLELIVTAADGVTSSVYTIQVTLQEKQSEITAFQFLAIDNASLNFDVDGTLDEVNKTVTVTLPEGVVLKDLIHTTLVTEGATIEKIIEGENVRFEVTSKDKNTVVSYIIVTNIISDRLVLKAIFDANPTSDIDWPVLDLTSDIASWSGVTVEDGRVVRLEKDKLTIVPKEIKYLTALRVLNLNYSFLDSLPEELRYIYTLTNISLIANNLTALPDWFGELPNLERIDLSRNKFNAFPNAILGLTQLKYLFIRFNRGLSELPDNIGTLSSVLELDVSGNSLGTLPIGIKDLVKARRLNFSKNLLNSIPKEIANIGGLELLDLKDNRSLRSVPQEICDLNNTPGFLLYTDVGVCP